MERSSLKMPATKKATMTFGEVNHRHVSMSASFLGI